MLTGQKIAILIEGDFYENEIFYYALRFAEEGAQVHFMSRLWGQSGLTFYGHEFKAPMYCGMSFEDIDDEALSEYAAVIVPAGMVADRLRYSEDVNKLPPACEFLKRAFAMPHVLKGIICHGMWLMSPINEVIAGRRVTVHNNLISDAKHMGLVYENADVVVDGDLVTARTGGHCNLFARRIIDMLT